MRRLALAICAALAVAATALPARATADSFFPRQWALQKVRAESSWGVGGTGAGVTVGIVDTGVDLGHEDLGDRVSASANCIGANGNPGACTGNGQDELGHGTHVAGIVSAKANNGAGVAGVAYDSKLVIAKSAYYDPQQKAIVATVDDIGAGIKWVVNHGATVVNLSFGIDRGPSAQEQLIGNSTTQALEAYIDWAWDHGAIPVLAAGNNSKQSSSFTNVNGIVVTATDQNDNIASYASSLNGSLTNVYRWAMAAPGGFGDSPQDNRCMDVNIVSTYVFAGSDTPHQDYACLAGTSMAAPHVAAAAAILRGLGLSQQATVDRLLSSAAKLGPSSSYGSGRLDLAAATAGLGHPVSTTAPASTPTTRPARLRPAAARPSTRPAAIPATTATTAAPATTTTVPPTTVTEPPTTTTSSVTKVAAGPAVHDGTHGPNRPLAVGVAVVGLVAMASSSTVALRRRNRYRVRR